MPIRGKLIIMLLVGAAVASWISSLYYKELRAQDAVDHAAALKKVDDQRLAYLRELQAAQRRIGDIDAEYSKKIAAITKSESDFRQCVAAGRCGLRVNATYTPGPASGKASKAGDTGVGDGSAIRLNPVAERNYHALREGLKIQKEQLEAAQKILQECEE